MATTTQFCFKSTIFALSLSYNNYSVHVGKQSVCLSLMRFHEKILKCQSQIELQGCQKLGYLILLIGQIERV